MTQKRDRVRQKRDLSEPWVMDVSDVAALMEIGTYAVYRRLREGKLPVKPRSRRPYEWSSLDWHKWFEGEQIK